MISDTPGCVSAGKGNRFAAILEYHTPVEGNNKIYYIFILYFQFYLLKIILIWFILRWIYYLK